MNRDYQGLYSVGMAALFLGGFFLLLVFGARSYLNTVDVQDANQHSRALLSYLATSVHAGDSADAVSVRGGEFGTELLIADGESGVGLHIYCADGQLLEEYGPLDALPDPDAAVAIAPTETFSVERDGDLLRISCDAGTVRLFLRAGGGA